MKTLFTFFLVTSILLLGCKNENLIEEGILTGTIYLDEGNCFPNTLDSVCDSIKTKTIATSIAITKPSSDYDESLLIKKTNSLDDGVFSVNLPVGEYSVFVLDDTSYICYNQCTPILIKKNTKITIEGRISHVVY